MSKQKPNPESGPPHKFGDLVVSEAVFKRRKWAKGPPDPNQGILWDAAGKPSLSGQGDSKSVPPAAPDRTAAPPSEERTAAAGGGISLFQSNGHCCDTRDEHGFPDESERVLSPEDVGEVVGRAYRVRACRCRKWFCEYCGPRRGFQLRQRLLARLATFTSVYGVTLTLDGSLFAGPEQAWLYVMENRLLARMVRDLDRRGHLHAKVYFWVVEFQKQTEQPHWHVLLDAKYIPHGEIVEIWSRFRPADAQPLADRITAENYQGQAPAFGSVRYTSIGDSESAGFYATKYLTKYPQEGYPDWVLDRVGRMPRYGHSQRFFPRVSGHDPMCFCDECRGEVEPPPQQRRPADKTDESKRVRRPSVPTSIRQRLEQCGNSCTIVQVKRVRLADGTVVDGRGRYDGKLNLSFREACEFLGLSPEDRWQIELSGEQATALETYARQLDEDGEAA